MKLIAATLFALVFSSGANADVHTATTQHWNDMFDIDQQSKKANVSCVEQRMTCQGDGPTRGADMQTMAREVSANYECLKQYFACMRSSFSAAADALDRIRILK